MVIFVSVWIVHDGGWGGGVGGRGVIQPETSQQVRIESCYSYWLFILFTLLTAAASQLLKVLKPKLTWMKQAEII